MLSLDAFLRPILKLPVLAIPRLGYKQLALVQASKGLTDDNLQFPYGKVQTFSEIFFEYKAIIEAGFVLQIDDPRLATHYDRTPDASIEECRRFMEMRIEAVNHALDALIADQTIPKIFARYGITYRPPATP